MCVGDVGRRLHWPRSHRQSPCTMTDITLAAATPEEIRSGELGRRLSVDASCHFPTRWPSARLDLRPPP